MRRQSRLVMGREPHNRREDPDSDHNDLGASSHYQHNFIQILHLCQIRYHKLLKHARQYDPYRNHISPKPVPLNCHDLYLSMNER